MPDQLNILVIDDDGGDRMTLRRLLRRSGIVAQVSEAASARAAEASATDAKPDFIFLDFCIPGEDAVDTLDRLRLIWPGSATCVITGQGDEEKAALVLKSGAADYLPKRALSEAALRRIVESGVRMNRLRIEIASQQEALQSFAYVLAHDMKSPIRAISFLQEVLREDLDAGGDLETARSYARKIGAYADRAMALIDSLTSHFSLDDSLPVQRCNLTELAEAAVENLHPEIAATGAVVRIGQLPVCDGIPAEFVQLFQNLIGNGIKYCRGRVPFIRVEAGTDRGGKPTVSVVDNGIGIAGEHAESIFEPFKRLHSHDDFSGSGLGLATCRKIVERLDGQLWCVSEPDIGSTFTFTLHPAAAAAA